MRKSQFDIFQLEIELVGILKSQNKGHPLMKCTVMGPNNKCQHPFDENKPVHTIIKFMHFFQLDKADWYLLNYVQHSDGQWALVTFFTLWSSVHSIVEFMPVVNLILIFCYVIITKKVESQNHQQKMLNNWRISIISTASFDKIVCWSLWFN